MHAYEHITKRKNGILIVYFFIYGTKSENNLQLKKSNRYAHIIGITVMLRKLSILYFISALQVKCEDLYPRANL